MGPGGSATRPTRWVDKVRRVQHTSGHRRPAGSISLTPGDPLAPLAGWIAAGRVDEAARARARQRWLERQAREEATLGGVLVDLAERGRPVMVSTVGRRGFRGPVRAVGADFVVIREDGLGDVIVPLRSLASVRPAPGEDGGGGDRPFTVELVLAETLVEIAADNPTVLVVAGSEELRGELRSAGIDVLSIVLGGPRHDIVHVHVSALDHIAILVR